MRVLVIGYGGREHALVWKLKQSPSVNEIFCAPGNPGMIGLADCVPIDASNIVELADFALSVNINLTVVGPELSLDLGIVDEFNKRNLPIFGPTRAAAEIESSKVFAKEFMHQLNIPTARFHVATTADEGRSILDRGEFKYPLVIKADGLASGKGVTVCHRREEAEKMFALVMQDRKFGKSGDRIVIEEFLEGQEISFQVISDGKRVLPLATSQDHKTLLDGDQGPNTGGMGAYSPSVYVNKESHQKIMNEIILPTISAMADQGRQFRGVLYAGLMLTKDGPKVLEYNVRFGDPETQVLLPRMECDFAETLMAAARGRLDEAKVEWKKEACVSVVLASTGYPGEVELEREIKGLDKASAMDGVVVFHAGTKMKDGKLLTSGGRVLTVTATSHHLSAACERVYQAVSAIHFDGMHYRKDIAKKALEYLKH